MLTRVPEMDPAARALTSHIYGENATTDHSAGVSSCDGRAMSIEYLGVQDRTIYR